MHADALRDQPATGPSGFVRPKPRLGAAWLSSDHPDGSCSPTSNYRRAANYFASCPLNGQTIRRLRRCRPDIMSEPCLDGLINGSLSSFYCSSFPVPRPPSREQKRKPRANRNEIPLSVITMTERKHEMFIRKLPKFVSVHDPQSRVWGASRAMSLYYFDTP